MQWWPWFIVLLALWWPYMPKIYSSFFFNLWFFFCETFPCNFHFLSQWLNMFHLEPRPPSLKVILDSDSTNSQSTVTFDGCFIFVILYLVSLHVFPYFYLYLFILFIYSFISIYWHTCYNTRRFNFKIQAIFMLLVVFLREFNEFKSNVVYLDLTWLTREPTWWWLVVFREI
jgi:hypothetical protein